MARKLVDEMTRKWEPDDFRDSYWEDLMRRIKERIRKNQIHELATEPPVEKRPKAQVIDLMDALKKSLELRGNAPKSRSAPNSAVRICLRSDATDAGTPPLSRPV